MFDQQPTFRELGESLGGSYYTGRRLGLSGAVRIRKFPNGNRADQDDCNKLLAEGMTDEQRRLYSAYVKTCNESSGESEAA